MQQQCRSSVAEQISVWIFPLQNYACTLHTTEYYTITGGSLLSYYRGCTEINEEKLLHML